MGQALVLELLMPITPILITEGLTTSGAQMESQSYSPLSDMGDLVDETFHPHGNTPPRRTKKSAAISSAHEKKTDELDGCRCFVTNVYSPGISIQSAYILAGEAEPDTVSRSVIVVDCFCIDVV